MKKALQLSMIVGVLATLTGCGHTSHKQTNHKKEDRVTQSSVKTHQAESSMGHSQTQSSHTNTTSNSYWTEQQQQQLVTYMNQWGKQQATSFQNNPVDSTQQVVHMNDLTITDQPKKDTQEAKLSIDGQLVAVHVGGSNDKGYHIVAAFSGASSDFTHLRYLFVLHDGKPEVLVSDISKSIGPANGEPAVNFVKTSDNALQVAFSNIVAHKAVEAPTSSQKNIVNSVDEAKAIYKAIYGTDPSSEGKWFVKNGTYIYAWRDSNFGSERGATTIFPDGSVEYVTAGGGALTGGKCTYDDVKNGTAKMKLHAMSPEELAKAGIVDPFEQYNLGD